MNHSRIHTENVLLQKQYVMAAWKLFTDHLDQSVLYMKKEAEVQIEVRDILWAGPN